LELALGVPSVPSFLGFKLESLSGVPSVPESSPLDLDPVLPVPSVPKCRAGPDGGERGQRSEVGREGLIVDG